MLKSTPATMILLRLELEICLSWSRKHSSQSDPLISRKTLSNKLAAGDGNSLEYEANTLQYFLPKNLNLDLL